MLYDLQRSPEDCKKYGIDHEIIKEIKPIPIIQSKRLWKISSNWDGLNINSQKDIEKLESAKKSLQKGFHTGIMLSENCGKYSGMKVEDAKNLMKESN